MRRLASRIGYFLRQRETTERGGRSKTRPPRRLELEFLEDRCVPSGNASGMLTGIAFVDSIGSGIFNSVEVTLPGIDLTLTGKTSQGSPVSATATTNANGSFTFDNVLPGTYALSSSGGSVILGNPSVGGLVVSGSQTVKQDLGFRGWSPEVINMRMFLSSSTSADLPFAPAGSGTGLANYRPNNAPTIKTPIADISVAQNSSPATLDLAANFTDPDITNSTVRFDTTDGPINVQLFDAQAPQTVANFINYLQSGAYNNSIFHRLVAGFVLQGGGFTFDATSHSLPAIPANPPVQNEFGTSNTQGTLAMALSGNDKNSATNEFFFNLVNNSGSLDAQKFTVFGKLVGPDDQTVLTALAGTPVTDESNGNAGSPFSTIPLLNNYAKNDPNFPTNTSAANYLLVKDIVIVNRDEFLTYSVVANTNPSLVTAAVNPNDNALLNLTYAPNQTGTAVITVRATDRYGATVDDNFTIIVN